MTVLSYQTIVEDPNQVETNKRKREPTDDRPHFLQQPRPSLSSVLNSTPISISRPRESLFPSVIRSPDYHHLEVDDYFHPSSIDALSDYEVVLDDGTLQRRTVSLSTVPGSYSSYLDQQRRHHESNTAPPATESSPLLQQQKKKTTVVDVSDEDDDEEATFERRTIRRWFKLTYPQKMVIKCSMAYMLGSLFTFVPQLNTWVGGQAVASHLAATVTVFFNPAKTVGGMVEAAGYGWLFTVAALILCLVSVSLNNILYAQGHYLLSYGLTLGVWIGASSFIIAYFKGRMNRPSTGTASALAFIILLSTLVREPSPDRNRLYDPIIVIRQLFVLVAIGTVISVAVCLCLWPVTATKKLKSDINDSLQSLRVLLKLLTKTFLLDGDLPNFTANNQLKEAIKTHQSGFKSLKQSLMNAKREHPHSMQSYDEIVSSLQRLDRHIGGLRSSCGLQFEVMQQQFNIKADDQRRKMEHELRREKSHHDDEEPDESGELVQFIKTVRQPMKSLAYTCKQTIIHLQTQFGTTAASPPPSFRRLRQNLVAAMNLFEDSLHHALSRMYNRRNYSDLHVQLMKEFPADNIYLVYFFVFSMLEFAKELTILVNAAEKAAEPKKTKPDVVNKPVHDNAFFLPNNHNTLNTLHTPEPNTQRHKFSVKLWTFLSWFRQHNIKFAAKNMMTAVGISALAFIPQTQPYFYQYRMEWTLLTVMTLMAPTLGSTNLGAVLRVLATVAGCAVATLTYTLFPANPVVLTLLTWLYSIPAFWVILYHKHGRFGQVALLAYNLVVLYMYNHRNDVQYVDIGVVWLACVRCVTVSLGVVIGLVVTAYIWPYEARVELRKGLSDVLIQFSWLYKHLSTTHDAEEMLFHQTECQQALVTLRDLLVHAPSEPRLKGPFPASTYASMLNSCQNILDKFLALRIVVLKDVWPIHVHQQLLMGASTEFMEMVGNVLLYFYVLASALQLKTPLPPYLPPAERARVQLMRRLQYVLGLKSDECYMAYYAYIALMENIIRELNQLGKDMKDLFGSLIPQDQWTTYFAAV
ncbi:Fusaric acid resistance protein-like-domain-containing protein [Fennellomyces sp. T-0311]|nr:Fusaric acid resistance protein-like-domain-containing protein [Fennellomyces sp. T-0311]